MREATPVPDRSSATAAQIVARIRAGEAAAWDELVETYSRLIRAVGRSHRLGDSDVADVVQTTWMRAFEHLERLQQPDRLPAWLVSVARRESLRLLRDRKRWTPVEPEALSDIPDTGSVDATLLAEERDAQLWRAVESLPQRQKQTLTLLAKNPDASYEAIGSALGMPVGSIGPTRLRALSRLRRDAALLAMTA
jgi:RNA polymerase sigma factor (sigma-70 family)